MAPPPLQLQRHQLTWQYYGPSPPSNCNATNDKFVSKTAIGFLDPFLSKVFILTTNRKELFFGFSLIFEGNSALQPMKTSSAHEDP